MEGATAPTATTREEVMATAKKKAPAKKVAAKRPAAKKAAKKKPAAKKWGGASIEPIFAIPPVKPPTKK